jgi:hypothetical protein
MKATKSTKPNFGQKPPLSRTKVWGFFEIDQFWSMGGMGLIPWSS